MHQSPPEPQTGVKRPRAHEIETEDVYWVFVQKNHQLKQECDEKSRNLNVLLKMNAICESIVNYNTRINAFGHLIDDELVKLNKYMSSFTPDDQEKLKTFIKNAANLDRLPMVFSHNALMGHDVDKGL